MATKELVEKIRDYICGYDMPFERYLMLTEAADRLEELLIENQHLRNNLITQTALAQNGQSAIETNKQLSKQLNAAVEDLKSSLLDNDACSYCKHKCYCENEKCSDRIAGVGCYDEKGKYYDWKWSCLDFAWGDCPKLENTPCNGCDSINHFEWRGVQDE